VIEVPINNVPSFVKLDEEFEINYSVDSD